jgi:hypothetical protein
MHAVYNQELKIIADSGAVGTTPSQCAAHLGNTICLRWDCSSPWRGACCALRRIAERASELSGADALVTGTLAAAYAEAGRFSDAVATVNRAIQMAESQGRQSLIATNRQLLQLYQSNRAYHLE